MNTRYERGRERGRKRDQELGREREREREREQERERGWRPVDEHKTDRNRNGNESGNESSSRDGNEDRIREGGGEVKKCKKPHKTYRRDVGNGGDLAWVKRGKNADKKVLVQKLPTQIT